MDATQYAILDGGVYASRRNIDQRWKLADFFPVVDAAALLAGYEPTLVDRCHNDTYFEYFFTDLPVCMRAVVGAIESNQIPADIKYQENGQPHWGQTKILRSDLVTWLRSKGVREGYFADEIAADVPLVVNPFDAVRPVHLSHWDIKNDFTGYEAAALIAGLDPAHPHIEWWRAKPTQERLEQCYEQAREICSFVSRTGVAERTDYEEAFRKERGEVLVSLAMRDVIDLDVSSTDSELHWLTVSRWLNAQGSRFSDQNFSRDELRRWISANGVRSRYWFSRNGAARANERTGVAFEEFNPFVDAPPEWPMSTLNELVVRALNVLRKDGVKDLATLRAIADVVRHTVERERQRYLEEALDRHNDYWDQLRADAGDDYVEMDSTPAIDDLTDLEALKNAFDYDRLNYEGFRSEIPGVPFEAMFPVLALMKIDSSLVSLNWTKGNRWLGLDKVSVDGLADAANAALIAQEALLFFEHDTERRALTTALWKGAAEAGSAGAAGFNPNGPTKNVPGRIGHPVSIGGVTGST